MDPEEISVEEDLVTPERRAKGDLEVAYNSRGKVSRAIPLNLTIVKELIRRGVFPHHYEIYGVGFLELKNAFLAPWAARSSAVLLEQWGVGVSDSKAGEIYQNVCKVMGRERINIVQFVIETNKERENESSHEFYKECFECLSEIMDSEKERIKNEMLGV